MTTKRIVLTEPFIRHPAGLVFELDGSLGVAGWDDDEHLREKLNFADKRTYRLPDGGNGTAYDLPVSATAPCPPEVFQEVDLNSGPCRITHAAFQREGAAEDKWGNDFKLLEINGLVAQALEFPWPEAPGLPQALELYDCLRQHVIRSLPVENHFDGSNLAPGFYALRLVFEQSEPYIIRFIKSFPLLVLFSEHNSRFSVQKTLY